MITHYIEKHDSDIEEKDISFSAKQGKQVIISAANELARMNNEISES